MVSTEAGPASFSQTPHLKYLVRTLCFTWPYWCSRPNLFAQSQRPRATRSTDVCVLAKKVALSCQIHTTVQDFHLLTSRPMRNSSARNASPSSTGHAGPRRRVPSWDVQPWEFCLPAVGGSPWTSRPRFTVCIFRSTLSDSASPRSRKGSLATRSPRPVEVGTPELLGADVFRQLGALSCYYSQQQLLTHHPVAWPRHWVPSGGDGVLPVAKTPTSRGGSTYDEPPLRHGVGTPMCEHSGLRAQVHPVHRVAIFLRSCVDKVMSGYAADWPFPKSGVGKMTGDRAG